MSKLPSTLDINPGTATGGLLPPTFDYRPGAPRPTPSFVSNTNLQIPRSRTNALASTAGGGGPIEMEYFSDGEDESEDDDKEFGFPEGPKVKCPPMSHSQQDLTMDNSIAASMISLLDYNIFEGIVPRQEVTRSETEAFVPVGGVVASEKKRKEFIDYLRNSGFMAAISKMMLSLWEEDTWPDPQFAIEYFAKCLGYKLTIHDDLSENASYCSLLRVRIERLEVENDWMRRHLDNFETSETPIQVVDPTSFPPIVLQRKHKKRRDRDFQHSKTERPTGTGVAASLLAMAINSSVKVHPPKPPRSA